MTAQTKIDPNGPGSSIAGPWISGPRNSPDNNHSFANQGLSLIAQIVSLTQNGTTAVSATINVPRHSQFVDFISDSTVTWNSATSATLSIGTAAADSTYMGALNIAVATARLRPAFTTTQLAACLDTGSNETVVATVTPSGATSAGTTFVTMLYLQTQNYQNP